MTCVQKLGYLTNKTMENSAIKENYDLNKSFMDYFTNNHNKSISNAYMNGAAAAISMMCDMSELSEDDMSKVLDFMTQTVEPYCIEEEDVFVPYFEKREFPSMDDNFESLLP